MILDIFYAASKDLYMHEHRLLRHLITFDHQCRQCIDSLLSFFYQDQPYNKSCKCATVFRVKMNITLAAATVCCQLPMPTSNSKIKKLMNGFVTTRDALHLASLLLYLRTSDAQLSMLEAIDWPLIAVESITFMLAVPDNDTPRKCLLMAISAHLYYNHQLAHLTTVLLLSTLTHLAFPEKIYKTMTSYSRPAAPWKSIALIEQAAMHRRKTIFAPASLRKRRRACFIEPVIPIKPVAALPKFPEIRLSELRRSVIFDTRTLRINEATTLYFKMHQTSSWYAALNGPYQLEQIDILQDAIKCTIDGAVEAQPWTICMTYERMCGPDYNFDGESLGQLHLAPCDAEKPDIWLLRRKHIHQTLITPTRIGVASASSKMAKLMYYTVDTALREITSVEKFISELARHLIYGTADPITDNYMWLISAATASLPPKPITPQLITDRYQFDIKELQKEYEIIDTVMRNLASTKITKFNTAHALTTLRQAKGSLKRQQKIKSEQSWFKHAPLILGDPVHLFMKQFGKYMTQSIFKPGCSQYVPADKLWRRLKRQIDTWHNFIQNNGNALRAETAKIISANLQSLEQLFHQMHDPNTPNWVLDIVIAKILFGNLTWFQTAMRVITNWYDSIR